MRLLKMKAALAVAAAACATGQARAADRCDVMMSTQEAASGKVTPEALTKLRDIGPIYRLDYSRDILALSPDGMTAAFQIHRADPDRNRYCVGIVTVSLARRGSSTVIDTSDELIIDQSPAYGWAAYSVGVPITNTPRWSPDGRWILYLKRLGGRTEVWRAAASGVGPAKQLTHNDQDVEDFRIASDGKTIVFSTRPRQRERETAVDEEGMRGWRFDERALPIAGARPQAPAAQIEYFAANLDGGLQRPASVQEAAIFARTDGVSAKASAVAAGPFGEIAWTEPRSNLVYPAAYQIVAQKPGNKPVVCSSELCKLGSLSSIHWTGDGNRVRFIEREGWAGSQTAIYEWEPDTQRVKRVYVTEDNLIECQPIDHDLICLRETSLEPRHLARIALGSGRIEKLFDPNPQFASLNLGRVERVHWKNQFGVPFYGDVVYPTDFDSHRNFPLVVVLYRTRGFLRGGVGDEVPIQSFASNGYFVLSVDVQDVEAIVGKQKNAAASAMAFNHNFLGRRHILSAIETAVRSLIGRGSIDRKRVGIAGLSEGSSTVQYAALNSNLFAAGSMGSCCWEPIQDGLLGPKIAERYHERGWPKLIDRNAEAWSSISIMTQPERVKFPLLFQLADSEALAAVPSYTALEQAGVPADFYMFPNERHVKWQPGHRLAVYRRNLAWFDFWLKGDDAIDPEFANEAAGWKRQKDRWRNH